MSGQGGEHVSPPLGPVLETGLYVEDLERAAAFYEGVLGLAPMLGDPRFRAYPLGGTVLLLFKRGAADQTLTLPGGTIPPHDASGRAHVALAIPAEALEPWRTHLARHAIPIEGEMAWPKGGVSLYFRDPDGTLLELATPGLWPNY
ncbi:VOC family protein [Xanthobacter sp. DSM 24535]|uniref:VOC family protein n=1 Tax=Roseixanthobacter psychrophilus TaxID=3119917 RepID=UPI003727D04C